MEGGKAGKAIETSNKVRKRNRGIAEKRTKGNKGMN